MITNAAMWFLPAEAIPQIATLLIMLCGVAVILQLFRVAMWLGAFAFLLLAFEPIIEPALETLMDAAVDQGFTWAEQLPGWIVGIIAAILGLMALRVILSWFFGRRVADNAVGHIIGTAVVGLILFIARAPFRVAAFLLGRRNN